MMMLDYIVTTNNQILYRNMTFVNPDDNTRWVNNGHHSANRTFTQPWMYMYMYKKHNFKVAIHPYKFLLLS